MGSWILTAHPWASPAPRAGGGWRGRGPSQGSVQWVSCCPGLCQCARAPLGQEPLTTTGAESNGRMELGREAGVAGPRRGTVGLELAVTPVASVG